MNKKPTKQSGKHFWMGYILAKEEDLRYVKKLINDKISQIKRVKKKIEKDYGEKFNQIGGKI